MKLKYTKTTLTKIEQIFKESDYTIRYEKGQFKSGYCLIYQKKIIVINKFFDAKGRIESLLDIFSQVMIDSALLSPEAKSTYEAVYDSISESRQLVA